ncbi:hypothetical protein E1176_10440, partial [Fulvivirga sp. RKSG066]|nr:hypothetical protein [Fulvivirga aurantia]
MSIIQKTGIAFLLFGSALLISLLFISNYKITDETLEKAISKESERALVKRDLNEMTDQSYSSSFAFNAAVKDNLQRANKNIKDKYAISESEISDLVNSFEGDNISYNNEKVSGLFSDTEVGQFK